MARKPSVFRATRSRWRREFALSTTIPDMPTDRNWRDGSPRAARSARRVPGSWRRAGHRGPGGAHFRTDHTRARVFQPLLDDVYELATEGRRCSMGPITADWRRRPWPGSTGIMTCQNLSSTSMIISRPPQTIARAASSFEGCGVRWMNETKMTTPAASTTSANYLAYAASQTRLPSSSPALTLLTSRAGWRSAPKRHAEVEAKGIQVTVHHGNKVVTEGESRQLG